MTVDNRRAVHVDEAVQHVAPEANTVRERKRPTNIKTADNQKQIEKARSLFEELIEANKEKNNQTKIEKNLKAELVKLMVDADIPKQEIDIDGMHYEFELGAGKKEVFSIDNLFEVLENDVEQIKKVVTTNKTLIKGQLGEIILNKVMTTEKQPDGLVTKKSKL